MMGIRTTFCMQVSSIIGKLTLMALLGSQHLLHEKFPGMNVLFEERGMHEPISTKPE